MVDIRFTMDTSGFKRDLARAVADATSEAIDSAQRELQTTLDHVFEACHDEPIEKVLGVLRPAMARIEISMTNDELRSYAEAISQGDRISVVRG